VTRSNVRR